MRAASPASIAFRSSGERLTVAPLSASSFLGAIGLRGNSTSFCSGYERLGGEGCGRQIHLIPEETIQAGLLPKFETLYITTREANVSRRRESSLGFNPHSRGSPFGSTTSHGRSKAATASALALAASALPLA